MCHAGLRIQLKIHLPFVIGLVDDRLIALAEVKAEKRRSLLFHLTGTRDKEFIRTREISEIHLDRLIKNHPMRPATFKHGHGRRCPPREDQPEAIFQIGNLDLELGFLWRLCRLGNNRLHLNYLGIARHFRANRRLFLWRGRRNRLLLHRRVQNNGRPNRRNGRPGRQRGECPRPGLNLYRGLDDPHALNGLGRGNFRGAGINRRRFRL